jgi:hypothetical protein
LDATKIVAPNKMSLLHVTVLEQAEEGLRIAGRITVGRGSRWGAGT